MDAKTLALYLGCRIRVNKYGKDFLGTLEGMTNNELWIRIDGDRAATPERYFAKCTLVLRPLDSMTESESEEYQKLSRFNTRESWAFAKSQARAINYLRSVGIDCDELIEKGKAIDSTTLTPTP